MKRINTFSKRIARAYPEPNIRLKLQIISALRHSVWIRWFSIQDRIGFYENIMRISTQNNEEPLFYEIMWNRWRSMGIHRRLSFSTENIHKKATCRYLVHIFNNFSYLLFTKFSVVSLNYWSIPKKRVHPTYLMNILRDSLAFDFQWFIPTTKTRIDEKRLKKRD